jgi:hypothetical protein
MSIEMAAMPVLLIVVVAAIFILRKGKGAAAGQQKEMADFDASMRRGGFRALAEPGPLIAPIAEVLAVNHRSTTILKAYTRAAQPDVVLCLVRHRSMGAGVAGTSTRYQVVGARSGRFGSGGDFLLVAIAALPGWAGSLIEQGLHHGYLAKTRRYTLTEGHDDRRYTLFTDDYAATEPCATEQIRRVSSTGSYMLAKRGDTMVVQILSPGPGSYGQQANAVLRLLSELDPSP